MFFQDPLDLGGVDVDTVADDQVGDPVDDRQVSGLVERPGVTEEIPPVLGAA